MSSSKNVKLTDLSADCLWHGEPERTMTELFIYCITSSFNLQKRNCAFSFLEQSLPANPFHIKVRMSGISTNVCRMCCMRMQLMTLTMYSISMFPLQEGVCTMPTVQGRTGKLGSVFYCQRLMWRLRYCSKIYWVHLAPVLGQWILKACHRR